MFPILFAGLAGLLIFLFSAADKGLLTQAEMLDAPEVDLTRLLRLTLGYRIAFGFSVVGFLFAAYPLFALVAAGLVSFGLGTTLAGAIGIYFFSALFVALFWWLGYIFGDTLSSAGNALQSLANFLALLVWPITQVAHILLVKTIFKEHTEKETLRLFSASPDPVWQLVQDQDGTDAGIANRQIFENATELSNTRVRECMVPRIELVASAEEDGIEGLRDVFIKSGYSKVPIYSDSIDNVLGYAHSSALFKKPKQISDIISEIMVVPESMTASQLLIEFGKEKKSIALVVDEYGSTSGLVTMEDVMEEIFGDIQDESDTNTETDLQESEFSFLFSARLEVDYINEKYDLDLPTGEFESLGGLVVSLHQDLPTAGETIEAYPFLFDILEVETTKIKLIRLRIEQ